MEDIEGSVLQGRRVVRYSRRLGRLGTVGATHDVRTTVEERRFSAASDASDGSGLQPPVDVSAAESANGKRKNHRRHRPTK